MSKCPPSDIGPEKSILEESNGGDSDDIDVEAFEGFV
jgi:hypothetical protein